MGKKTVLRRLLKRVPQSPDLAAALAADDDTDDQTPPEPPAKTRLATVLENNEDTTDPRADGAADVGDTPAPEEGSGGAPTTPPAASEPFEARTITAPPLTAHASKWLDFAARVLEEIGRAPDADGLMAVETANSEGVANLGRKNGEALANVRAAFADRYRELSDGAASPPVK